MTGKNLFPYRQEVSHVPYLKCISNELRERKEEEEEEEKEEEVEE